MLQDPLRPLVNTVAYFLKLAAYFKPLRFCQTFLQPKHTVSNNNVQMYLNVHWGFSH